MVLTVLFMKCNVHRKQSRSVKPIANQFGKTLWLPGTGHGSDDDYDDDDDDGPWEWEIVDLC